MAARFCLGRRFLVGAMASLRRASLKPKIMLKLFIIDVLAWRVILGGLKSARLNGAVNVIWPSAEIVSWLIFFWRNERVKEK